VTTQSSRLRKRISRSLPTSPTCDRGTRTWSRTGSLDPTDQAEEASLFGLAVTLQGRLAVVGAQNAVRLYEKKQGTWRPVLKLPANGIDEFIEAIEAAARILGFRGFRG
jgi:hypothetical protein